MIYNFDEVIDRKNSNSLKYDFAVERGRPVDVLPLWVADMDFRTAPCILERLQKHVELGIFGYSDVKSDYFQAMSDWYQNYYQWKLEEKWLVKTPGVVFAIATAIRAFTKPGDRVLIQEPVYYPFRRAITDNERIVVNNPLVLIDGHYEIDFEDFEEKIVSDKVKLFVLCNPHNPVGRVWKEWELRKMGEICLSHQVLVVSDEIHSDFIYNGFQHLIFANLEERFADNSITCTAPSKTFNLAGLQVSNIIISNQNLRLKFAATIDQAGYSQLNMFGLIACQAAYEGGRDWLEQLKLYLTENLAFVRDYLRENIPDIKLIEPEGTYLIWLDCRALKLSEKERKDLIINKAKLWLDSGVMFGANGVGFERINIACPRSIIREALERLKEAINNL
ncbi:MAG: Bifunctional PLP-dependent enzyme with beta-cystathionase and maltose regulon repressor [Herbinix sp.]|jgi:cystathionine beta-lyase|nr:Bifunctional PLP-dependent enzyme with beta-cystathionase and maltose regulon repressor [Herbinix sp.]